MNNRVHLWKSICRLKLKCKTLLEHIPTTKISLKFQNDLIRRLIKNMSKSECKEGKSYN